MGGRWTTKGIITNEKILSVLLFHEPSSPLRALRQALRGQGVETREVQTCQETVRLLAGAEPPELVFTDTQLPDGNWADVVRLAEESPAPVNVIVVSRVVDVPFYVETLQSGAFDFIAPPFEPAGLAHIVRVAAGNVASRRQRLGRTSRAPKTDPEQLELPAA